MYAILLLLDRTLALEPVLLLGHFNVEREVEDRRNTRQLIELCQRKRDRARSRQSVWMREGWIVVVGRTLARLVHRRKDESFAASIADVVDKAHKALALLGLARAIKSVGLGVSRSIRRVTAQGERFATQKSSPEELVRDEQRTDSAAFDGHRDVIRSVPSS